jgi:coenzyme F420 biosynthesis associated uncharacterized protein
LATISPRTSRSVVGPASAVGAGILVGVAAGVLWAAARRQAKNPDTGIFDWDRAAAIALRTLPDAGRMSADERAMSEAAYSGILRDIAAPLAAYTEVTLPLADIEVQALDRQEWIHRNIDNFHALLQPFEDLYRGATGGFDLPGFNAIGRLAISGEIGVLLGYLARRVLGQYDIGLLGVRASEPGKLYFVEPNIQNAQLRLGLPHQEFRVWLALHEVTHACEFEGHPWVREYLNETLHEYLESMVGRLKDGGGSLSSIVTRAMERWVVGGNLIDALMTPRQRELVSRLQATMSLLEGYSNHVMNAVGKGILPHLEEIEQRVESRSRQRGATELLFLRLTGLQMKLDQYRLGAAFVNRITDERGIAFMNRVWAGPENLPSESEILDPAGWMARMDQVPAR